MKRQCSRDETTQARSLFLNDAGSSDLDHGSCRPVWGALGLDLFHYRHALLGDLT
jgi:hypothetical protein